MINYRGKPQTSNFKPQTSKPQTSGIKTSYPTPQVSLRGLILYAYHHITFLTWLLFIGGSASQKTMGGSSWWSFARRNEEFWADVWCHWEVNEPKGTIPTSQHPIIPSTQHPNISPSQHLTIPTCSHPNTPSSHHSVDVHSFWPFCDVHYFWPSLMETRPLIFL